MRGKIIYIVLCLSLAANIFLAVKCWFICQERDTIAKTVAEQTQAKAVLEFTKVFVENVLQTDKTVDFETRLVLENKVRDLNNPEILAQWNKFTGSNNSDEAKVEVKKLLMLLIENSGGAK